MIWRQKSGLRVLPTRPFPCWPTPPPPKGCAQKCKEVGFTAFLTKPARRNILLRTLARILGARDDDQRRPPEEQKLVTQYSVREELKQSVRILLAEDNPVNQKLATMMLTKAGYTVTVVANGRLAVDVFTEKPERFRHHSHGYSDAGNGRL